jgi:PAS domain S-box-containing protein
MILAAFVVVAGLAWLGWGDVGIQRRTQTFGLLLAIPSGLAGLMCLAAAYRSRILRQRLSWLAFGAGVLLMAANGARLWFQAAGTPLIAVPGDALRLLALLAFLLGLVLQPRRRRRGLLPAVQLLDVAVLSASGLVLFWMLIFHPLLLDASGYPILLLYPVLGLALLLIESMLLTVNDSPNLPDGVLWVASALFVYGLAAIDFGFQLQSSAVVTLTISDIGWVTGGLLMLLAMLSRPLEPWKTATPATRLARLLDFGQRSLPYFLTLLAAEESLRVWLVEGRTYPLAGLIIGVMVLILIARNFVVAGEDELLPYASLVNGVAEPAFVCDESGRLRLVNPALLSTTGYPSAAMLLGQPLAAILHEEAAVDAMVETALGRSIDPAATRPVGWMGETRLLRRDGSYIPVYLSLRPIHNSRDLPETAGKHLALAGTAHDLTHQKQQQATIQAAYQEVTRAREQLQALNADLENKVAEETENLNRANQQLEEQNRRLQILDRMKSDFVSMVSHELRAPLTNINGGIELTLSRPLDSPLRTNLELVQAEILRLTRFVETILDLSALDAGRLPLYNGPVAFEAVVLTMQTQLVHLPGLARIRWQAPPNLPYMLADERALTSVLFHLLDNALKYAPQGEILISAAQVSGKVCVQVMDSGPGIPPDAIPLLFDRFYRVNSEDSQTVYGHGLGLYIVRRLIEAMDGSIEVSNRPEGGACFTCCFPATTESEDSDAL